MDVGALAWTWFLLPLIIHCVKATSFLSTRSKYEYEKNKPTANFEPAPLTERFESRAPIDPIQGAAYIYEPAVKTRSYRLYRQADLEAFTSIEPILVTESTASDLSDLTAKSNPSATTESINSDMTVIPLTSTLSYNFRETPEVTEDYNTGTFIPITTTDIYAYLELSETAKNNPTLEVKQLTKEEESYDNLESTSKLYGAFETVEPSTELVSSSDKVETDEPSNTLPVVGISKMRNNTEKIMTLQPSKEEKYVWVKEIVHNMLESTMLKKETEDYVNLLNERYVDLPVVEADNYIWRKYSRAIAESFVLDFCRNYPHYTASKQWEPQWYRAEEYNHIYNTTLLHLHQKKAHTAIQIATPVRRAADIYKAILDTPIGIVQSKCRADMQQWMCLAEYIVHLEDISESCEYIWYHAQVHLTVLQSIRLANGALNPANEIIAELDSRLSSVESNNDVNFLFDLIVQTLDSLAQTLKEVLLSHASLYNFIRELQSEEKLLCLSIDEQRLWI